MVYTIHYLVFCLPQPFFIEDAGISFAYARHLVDGEGLVAYPGGERVEGYSNPLWTFVVAGFYALGIPTWTSAKLLGWLLGVATLPIVYALTCRMSERRTPTVQTVALLTPLALALSPQFVIWNASGLENALFCFLLSAGVWRLVKESEDVTHWPVSAVLFFLLTATRPEGIMYAAIALIARVMYAIADRRGLSVLSWLTVFAVPFVVYNGWRYWYFAWLLPNTYYAKMGMESTFRPFGWTVKGWKYVNGYLLSHGVVLGLPLVVFALVGIYSRWKRRLAVGIVVVITAMVLFNGSFVAHPEWWPTKLYWPNKPSWWSVIAGNWVEARVWAIVVSGILMGLVTLGRPGWRVRGLLWANCASGVFFAIYAGGDWMDEYRWFNIVSVSLIPLLAVGLADVVDYILDGREVRSIGPLSAKNGCLVLAMGALCINGVGHSIGFATHPETSVRDINRRVRYMTWVQNRLDMDHVVLLDVDMGAHMFYSGWDIVDIAGLVDVSIAHHNYNHRFTDEYLFTERQPDFAHVHGGWARTSRIPRRPLWKADYIEIPGYPIGRRRLHIGNHIRKDLFVRLDSDEAGVLFGDSVELIEWSLPSPEVCAGGQASLRMWWQANDLSAGFRVLVWMDDGAGHRAVTGLQPGYGWYEPEDWDSDEQVAGRFWVQIPPHLPLGEYRVGVVVIDEHSGEVVPHSASETEEFTYLPGEYVLPETISVVTNDEVLQHVAADLALSTKLFEQGSCEAGWQAWKDATRHISRRRDWAEQRDPDRRSQQAACWLHNAQAQVESGGSREVIVSHLLEAMRWDHRLADLLPMARQYSQQLNVQGDALAAQQDWAGAYHLWTQALGLDPRQSRIRRKAEMARDKRLGLSGADRPDQVTLRPAAPVDEENQRPDGSPDEDLILPHTVQ